MIQYEECTNAIICARIYYVAFEWEQLEEWHQATYFIGYGLGRFWIEGLRTDNLYLFPELRISQAVSLVLIIAGLVIIVSHSIETD